jgi:hypothetical protein
MTEKYSCNPYEYVSPNETPWTRALRAEWTEEKTEFLRQVLAEDEARQLAVSLVESPTQESSDSSSV